MYVNQAEVLAARRKLAIGQALLTGPLDAEGIALAAAGAGLPLPINVVLTYPHTLKRIGMVERTEPFGRPVYRLTTKGRAWVDAVLAGRDLQAEQVA